MEIEEIETFAMISFINGARQAFDSILKLREVRHELDIDSLFDSLASVKARLDESVPPEIREIDDKAPAFEIKLRKETLQ